MVGPPAGSASGLYLIHDLPIVRANPQVSSTKERVAGGLPGVSFRGPPFRIAAGVGKTGRFGRFGYFPLGAGRGSSCARPTEDGRPAFRGDWGFDATQGGLGTIWHSHVLRLVPPGKEGGTQSRSGLGNTPLTLPPGVERWCHLPLRVVPLRLLYRRCGGANGMIAS
jgi:hypothetical protein